MPCLVAARCCWLYVWTKCAFPRTQHSLNVCNLASLLHSMHTFKRNLYDWYVSTNPAYTQSVTTFVISELIKLFVRKYLFKCLSWLFYWVLQWKWRFCEMKGFTNDSLARDVLSTTHARRWEKLFSAPPLFLLLECFIDGISSLKTATNESAPWHSLLAAHLI